MQKTTSKRLLLRKLTRTFSISFRFRPAYMSAIGNDSESGCEIELIGQHAAGQHINGGCQRCIEVLFALLELMECILSEPPRLYGVECKDAPFEKWIRYASTAGDWPEVVLDAKITRRPILGCQPGDWRMQVTDEIRTELLNLGCREVPFVYISSTADGKSRTRSVM